MESNAINAVDFRETQHANWDSAAAGWKQWDEFSERAYAPISERLVELAGVESGTRVLDVAAGYGEPSLTAARKCGPDGQIVASDISSEMLAFGRERATAAGITNVEFIQSAAADLDLAPSSFDAAVSRWGIIFEPDGEFAAERVRGFLKPGSRFAISSWGEPEQVPFLSIPMRTTMKRFDVPPPPAGTPGPLSRPTPAALISLLEGGGFSDITVEEAVVELEFDSPAHFTEYVRAIVAPVRAMIEGNAGEAQEEAWDAITQAAAEVGGGAGPLRLSNVVLLASGVS